MNRSFWIPNAIFSIDEASIVYKQIKFYPVHQLRSKNILNFPKISPKILQYKSLGVICLHCTHVFAYAIELAGCFSKVILYRKEKRKKIFDLLYSNCQWALKDLLKCVKNFFWRIEVLFFIHHNFASKKISNAKQLNYLIKIFENTFAHINLFY